jgi:gliding motility-associated-like protein
MRASIGSKLRILFLIATFSYISFDSFAQFYVGGKLCIGSAPAIPPPPVGTTTSADCGEPTTFFDTEKDATAWLWNFGDSFSDATNNTSTLRNPKHFYSAPGTYTVTLIRTIGLIKNTVTKAITIDTPPVQPLFFKKEKLDTTLCDGKTLKLDPYFLKATPSGATFLWFPNGETTPTIDVTKAGCYSVEVFNASGACSKTAQINVKFCMQPPAAAAGIEKWYFGSGATLDFTIKATIPIDQNPLDSTGTLFADPNSGFPPTYIPVPATKTNPINSPEGSAMAYDPSGTLVLYTDGVDIYGKDDQVLSFLPPLTDSKLSGTNTATQSSVIVPKGSCNECPHHLYHVYTINKTTGLLSYNVVDLRRNGGKGAVVEKDVPVSLQTSQRLTAMSNQGEDGFFVYSHDAGTNTFRILKIDSTGVTETVQNLGLVYSEPISERGYMRLSATGEKMAVAVVKGGKNYIEVFDINKTTGALTNPKTIDLGIAAPPSVYGVEFSDNEKLLYVTLRGDPSAGIFSYLYQLNLNLGNPTQIATNKIEIDKSKIYAFGALQAGPTNGGGGRFIYMAIDGINYLPYIQDPDQKGNASIVGYQSITSIAPAEILGNSGFGFPNIIHAKPKEEGDGLSATYEGNCQGKPTTFSTGGICDPMKVEFEWDFGDGSKGTGKEPSHIYTQTGTYTVTLTAHVYSETAASKVIKIPILGNTLREKCNDIVVTDVITIKPSPLLNLADDAYACIKEGASILLDPKIQQTVNPTYKWNVAGGTTPTVIAGAAGVYAVAVTNNFSNNTTCTNQDKIEVKDLCDPRLFVPEVFTPNNDLINDKLEIPNAHITDFELRIFNRWGEIIFESTDPDRLWDGTYHGKIIAPMIYAFVVSYKSSDFPDREKITRRGGIMLMN